MCAVSQVGNQFHQQYQGQVQQAGGMASFLNQITRQEFENLKQEVFQLKDELKKARAQDIANNEPDCSHAHKVDLLRGIAAACGVNLGDIFGDSDKEKT